VIVEQAADYVILDEFFAPGELAALTDFALTHESDFRASEVVRPDGNGGVIDFDFRRSKVLFELGEQRQLIAERVMRFLPRVLDELAWPFFEVRDIEAQITASNDGEFFQVHSDNHHEELNGREITFVYFFHAEPKRFSGGELRLYDSRFENGNEIALPRFRAVVPQQNQVVFFPSHLMHEVTRVRCAMPEFAASRFTLNGWVHR
jgi:Rps23 Pro-64 3,4-dihydroxylase Tpa1-like proline 4-hydroxylase